MLDGGGGVTQNPHSEGLGEQIQISQAEKIGENLHLFDFNLATLQEFK